MRSDMLVLRPQMFACQMKVLKCACMLMAVGSCLRMLGGWFECLFMYNGSSLGFL